MKWILGKEKKWNCEHYSRKIVLIDENDGYLFQYNTEYPEPSGDYKYIYLDELLREIGYYPVNRKRVVKNCTCKKE